MRRAAASALRRFSLRTCCVAAIAALLGLVFAGCKSSRPAPPPEPGSRYPQLPAKQVPPYLKGSIFELTEVVATNPQPVSGYGLIGNLAGTGDTRAPNVVREHMIKQMERHGFGSRQLGYGDITPERVLADPRFAIVRVDGFIPPGARVGQRMDVQVSCLDGNNTSSLASGTLYRATLKENGADPRRPGMAIDEWAYAEGSVFVNPVYALEREPTDPQARTSLRVGVVMDGGVVQIDRPILLRLRQPSYRVARQIEYRIDEFFQDSSVAAAMDDGVVRLTMPARFEGDWEHFRGVVWHLFFNTSPQFATLKAQQLAEEAQEPDAALLNISYCWEALGPNALPFVLPLMTHDRPDVAYAAARAAARLGDTSAQGVLGDMARSATHPFRLNAVQTLAGLPNSPIINGTLRSLLSADQMLVKVEAYRALARRGDSSIVSVLVKDRFAIDRVEASGPPLIYAARLGTPRIALFGRKTTLTTPITFTAMDGRFSISSNPGRSTVTIFYRGRELPKPVQIDSNPDIAEIAARLGGMGPAEEQSLNFSYGEIVAILQAICDQQKATAIASASSNAGPRMPVTFVLQDVPLLENSVYGAPVIPEPTRPTGADDPATQPTVTSPGTGARQEARR